MIPSDIILISDSREIRGDFTFKCKIDGPVDERIIVRDYVYEMAKKGLVDYHQISNDDILELTETYFKVQRTLTPFENYMICTLTGKFEMIRNTK